MSLAPSAVSLIIDRHLQDLQQAASSDAVSAHLQAITLSRVQSDLPYLLRSLNSNKTSKNHDATLARLNELVSTIDELSYRNQKIIELDAASRDSKNEEQSESSNHSATDLVNPAAEDDYMSLRKRLLADGTSTSLDQQGSADQMNEYHESFQEEILKDLSGLASALKTSTMSLSNRINDDAKVVDETGEKMMKTSSLMNTVGSNLNGYLSEKSGGKISLWFLIKSMIGIILIFFVALIFINFLPKM